MRSIARLLAAAGVAAVSLSCADRSTGLRASGLAWLPISPVFSLAPEGGPRIRIAAVNAVLKRPGAADSSVAHAAIRGDSAILEFPRVIVLGDSSTYELRVRAFDENDELVFKAIDEIRVKPGDNAPSAPVLEYIAADAGVNQLDLRHASLPVNEVGLAWAGGEAGNTSCLNRVPSTTATTHVQLAATGIADAGSIASVRVGWTSRDTSVATVDATGLVRARCSNKSTYVVARTYLNVADSVRIDVTAPPFTLRMTPETGQVPRLDSLQLEAVVIDENGNAITTTGMNWTTSDSSRATVSTTGVVRGISNGRALITASSGTRTTVAVLDVVAPRAASVVVDRVADTLAVGESRIFSATAFDANGEPIADAASYAWGSDDAGIARVNSGGVVTGVAAGDARIVVKINDRKDTALVHVRVATTGQASGTLIDGASGAAIAGGSVSGQGSPATSDATGRFVSAPQTPPRDLQASASGYQTVTYYAVPFAPGTTVDLGEIPLAPTSGLQGTLSGVVVNALNDAAVPNATVQLYPGINAPSTHPSSGATSPSAIAETTSDAGGSFTVSGIQPGTYTYLVTAAGFSFTRRVTVSIGGETRTSRIPLSPIISGDGGLRVVLSWGDCAAGTSNTVPCDLDAHMTGPVSAPDVGRFHVAYFNEFYLSGVDTVAVVDNDATDGLGPETITLRPHVAGTYKFYVHNYTDGSDTTSLRLTTAQARVDVYQGADLVATFVPPVVQPGTLWAVFQLDGTSLTPVNSILRIQDPGEMPGTFLRAPDSVNDDLRAIVRRSGAKP